MRWKLIAALAVAVAGVAVYVGEVRATPGSGQTTAIYAQSLFNDLKVKASAATPTGLWRTKVKTQGQSDLYVVDNKFDPGGTTGWHSHPGPSLIFVVSGTVTNYEADRHKCSIASYGPGTGFVDPGVDTVHMIKNNTDQQAETIAVQFLPTGAVRKIDEPDPGVCPGQ